MGHVPVSGVQYSPDLDRAIADVERLQAALIATQAEAKFLRERNADLSRQVDEYKIQNKSLRLMVTLANEHLERAQDALKDKPSEGCDAA